MKTPWDRKLVVARFPTSHLTVRVSGAVELRTCLPDRVPPWWAPLRAATLSPERLAALRDKICSPEFRGQKDCIGDGDSWVRITLYDAPNLYDTSITWGSRRNNDPPLDAVAPAYLVDIVALLGKLVDEAR